jgi:hypothetical protein
MCETPEDIATLAAKAWAYCRAIQMVEACDAAILQYAEMGISGTPHDIEHHQMREAAMAVVKGIKL